MDEIAKIAVEDFEKKPDGSWVCVSNSDVTTKAQNIIRIKPGMTFRKGSRLWGLDVVEALERVGGIKKA